MTTRVRELEAKLIQAQTAMECLGVLLDLAATHAATHRNREGLRCAREALNIARARGDALGAARALCVAARCHHQRGDHVAAAAAGFDAIQAFGDRDLVGRSDALRAVAEALLAVEALELAESTAGRAAADAIKAGAADAEARARLTWGTILARAGRHSDARRKFREAGALQRRLGQSVEVKKAALRIGDTYRAQANDVARGGEPGCARLLYRQAIRVYRVALGAGSSAADDALAHAAIGECECRLDDPAAALQELHRALLCAASPAALAHCHLWESHALRAMGKTDAARSAAECARNAAEQLDHDPILAECLKAESALNDLCGRFESAHDLEIRAERVLLERSATFAGVREELNGLLARHAEAAPAFLRAVA